VVADTSSLRVGLLVVPIAGVAVIALSRFLTTSTASNAEHRPVVV